jgi:hypothetical protein
LNSLRKPLVDAEGQNNREGAMAKVDTKYFVVPHVVTYIVVALP